MKKFAATGLLVFMGLCCATAAVAQRPQIERPLRIESFRGRPVAGGEIIVRFRQGSAEQSQTIAAQDTDIESSGPVGRTGALHIRSRGRDTAALLQAYTSRSDVLYAEPNFVYYANTIPNDPSFDFFQYALNNHGQTLNGQSGLVGADIKAAQAWDITLGSRSIVVGIVDTGVNYNHPDLVANVWSAPTSFNVTIGGKTITCPAGSHGFNAIARTCDPMDTNGHGTHVAGIVGATGNNGIGVTGVSPIASMMALQFLSADGSGTTADAIAAIEFAIQVRGVFGAAANVRVLNNSWGGASFSQALLDEINLAAGNDILFVTASGNDSTNIDSDPQYPASFDAANILTVAATDNQDKLASFSNYGTTHVHLAAPGVSIYSTLPPKTYDLLSGTSMAAPMVSGAAALVLSACPLSTATLKAELLGSVDRLSELNGKTATAGRLNVYHALTDCFGAPPQNFTITATPTVQSMNVGDSSNIDVSVSALQGFSGTVSLSATNLPPGLTASFSPAAISGGAGNSTMTLTAVANLAGGTYTVNVVGVSGAISHSVGVAIVANASISNHQTLTGSLTVNSPISKGNVKSYASFYTLQLPSPTSVTIDLRSTDFSTGLILRSSSGAIVNLSTVVNGGSTLATSLAAGTYVIEVFANTAGATGDFALGVNSPVLDTLRDWTFPGKSGSFIIVGKQLSGFRSVVSENLLTINSVTVTSSSALTVTYSVSPSATPGPRNVYVNTDQGTSNAVTFYVYPTPPSMEVLQKISGTLTAFDTPSTRTKGAFADFYALNVPLNGTFNLTLDSPDFNTFMVVFSKSQETQYLAGGTSGSNNSRLTDAGMFPSFSPWLIEVTSTYPGATGAYTLNVLPVPTFTGFSGNVANQGSSGTVTLFGNYFADNMTANVIDAGITLGAVTRVNFSTITIPYTIDPHASVSSHEFTVTANGQTSHRTGISVKTAPAQLWTMSPNSGFPGTSFTTTMTGDYFMSPLSLDLSSGVTVSNLKIINPNLATATVTVASNAVSGVRTATLSNASGAGGMPQNFTVFPPALIVSRVGNGGGKITSVPAGIDCGAACATFFATGQNFTLTAIPEAGSVFSGWSGDPDCLDGSVTMTAAKNCVARFDMPQVDSTLLKGDYDGDGKTDIVIYRPSTGEWYLRLSSMNYAIAQGNWYFQWGQPGDVPISGDFDGDGRSDIAVYRPSTGEWYIRLSTQNYAIAQGNWYFQWGISGDVPVTGDFDGDGKTDISVYRPSTGEWYIRSSTLNYSIAQGNWYFQWGQSGDQPIGGDFDGDGKADIAVYRPSTGEWYVRLSTRSYAIAQGNWFFQWGQPGDQPVAGDYDGDKKTDIAVYRPSTGEWYIRLSTRNYVIAQGDWYSQWGITGDLTVKGDFDGDLKADIAVYRPSTGEWFFRLSTSGYAIAQGNWFYQWGVAGDLPLRR